MGGEQNETNPKVNELTARIDDLNAFDQSNDVTSRSAYDLNVDVESNDINIADEVLKNSHNVPYVYRQDIVRHRNNGVIGIVNEVAGDSDSDSSITDDEDDEDEGDEDDEDEGGDGEGNADDSRSGDRNNGSGNNKNEILQADQVRVLWMDDTEPVQHANDITVVDRGFLHGDYVASASDPTGQVGVVLDVNISVDLLAPDGSIKKDISSRDLKRVREFAIGDYVVNGPWLGRVDDVLDNVTVLIDDGSVCKVVGAEPLRLKPISKSIFDEDDNTPYYPGQRVRASSSSVFKNSRWLSGLWKANRLEGTVIKVRAGSVFIYWLASAGYGPDSSTSPAEEQSPNNLKLLSCFSHANWQVGDWCLLPPSLTQSSYITLYKGLSKLELRDSIKSELDSRQLGNGCDSEEFIPEEPDENNESMDVDLGMVPDGNSGNIGNNASPESSSCGSSISASKDPVHEMWPLHRKKIRKVVIRRDKKTRKREENFERAHLIVNTRTRVDVQWQDGTVERGLESTMLIPIDSPGDHEFVAEQYVVEKASDDVDNAFETRRVGVVKSVNAKERTACVRWLKPVSRAEDPRQFDREEIVSVYELEEHPDYDYAYGDVVVRLSPVTISAQSTTDGESVERNGETARNDSIKARKRPGHKKEEDVSGDEASTNFSDLSWVGNITDLRNGDIEVTWADGMISTVGPQAIFVVGRDDDEMDSGGAGSEVSDDAASWETVNDDEMDSLENVQEEVGLRNATSVNLEANENMDNNNSGRSPALSLPLAALDFVTRLATGIFSRGRKNLDSDSSDDRSENECKTKGMINISEERDSSDESSSQKSHVFVNGGLQIAEEKGDEHAVMDMEVPISSNAAETLCNLRTEKSDSPPCSEDDTSSFKRFDIAKDPLDHHFLGSNGQINNGRKWLKKVQQDWSILQNNLPEGIYVRIYEDRMDLLRAVIVGAYGTPYQDGLFFFDFHLPPEYPDVPPSAYYHSGGWRINPNLYEEGKVCLSLLNTWTGKGNEVWDPMSSSILQILVSLQGLVLNSKPYFNEAGYNKQIGTAEGEKNSLSYNENTFLLNCKTMMYLMRKPPKDFHELVKEHFRKRGHYILKACDAYKKGSLIGSLAKDASVINNDDSNLTSVGFKLMLYKIVPKLYSALNEVGADCHGFEHLLQA
ncbi:probable ubiquitin-conjugating enzyme E2 23 [Euphorbia lathyris]|uniref:probable ubiquitin-conjugating enzyme E2 23 n=1 Tax=Euphorbia lathyris TaxID=212925 RepID=UPI003314087C